MAKNGWRKAWIWTLVGFVILTVILGIYINDLIRNDLKNYNENLRERNSNPCGDGRRQQCVDDDAEVGICEKGERTVCIGKDETYAICDTDRKERATCIDEDANTITCKGDQRATCIDKDSSYRVCSDPDYQATCAKEDQYGYWTGSSMIKCNIGQRAMCYDI